MVAEPDYRDYLIDQIEEKFGSRYRFCKETGIPEAFLSQVLSGKKEFSVETLRRAAQALGLGLALLPKTDLPLTPVDAFVALRQVSAMVGQELARVESLEDHLSRYTDPTMRLSAVAQERSLFGGALEEVLERLRKIPPKEQGEEALKLIRDKKRELEAHHRFIRQMLASLADQPGVLVRGDARDNTSLCRM